MVMTVRELIAALSRLNPEAKVLIKYEGHSLSRRPRYDLEVSEGYNGCWGHVLSPSYAGFDDAKRDGKTFPVVWL